MKCSSGSRISRWGYANTRRECTNLLFCKFFAENCMKMKEFGSATEVGNAALTVSDAWGIAMIIDYRMRVGPYRSVTLVHRGIWCIDKQILQSKNCTLRHLYHIKWLKSRWTCHYVLHSELARREIAFLIHEWWIQDFTQLGCGCILYSIKTGHTGVWLCSSFMTLDRMPLCHMYDISPCPDDIHVQLQTGKYSSMREAFCSMSMYLHATSLQLFQ